MERETSSESDFGQTSKECQKKSEVMFMSLENLIENGVIIDDYLLDYNIKPVDVETNYNSHGSWAEILPEPPTETAEEETPTPEVVKKFDWDENSIRLLLDIRFSKQETYIDEYFTQKKKWREVARELSSTIGVRVDEKKCRMKFKEMLREYRNYKKKNFTGIVHWHYFEQFDRVFGNALHWDNKPPPWLLGDSLNAPIQRAKNIEDEYKQNMGDICTNTTFSEVPCFEEIQQIRYLNSSKEGTEDKPIDQMNKDDVGRKFFDYLRNKLNSDCERNQRKMKLEGERWVKKRAKKEREIEAILRLADAISKPRSQASNLGQ